MADIGRDHAVDATLVEVTQANPAVTLDLTERAPHDIADRHRRTPRARGRQAGKHEQRLGISPHARREMVKTEEMLESFGVRFVVLELRDELELAGQKVLVATAEVDVRVGDAPSQCRLLDRKCDGAVLHLVERDLDLVYFATCVYLHRRHVGMDDALVDRRVQDLLDRRRQPLPGHRRGLVGQGAKRAGDPAVREPQQRDREHHRSDGDGDPVALLVLRRGGQAARLIRDDRGGVGLGDPQQADRVGPALEQGQEVRVQRITRARL